MKRLSVVQLASFTGNIGDNANHSGSRSLLAKNLNCDLQFTNLEIRDYFRKTKKFDASFVELVNQFDLLMIGGGNYFELWVDESATGTSVDFSNDLLKSIRVPIVFYALGVDPAQGASPTAITKFRKFLDVVLASKSCLVSVRNDGSMDAVRNFIGSDYAERIYRVPDGGFFVPPRDFASHPELPTSKQVMAINLAGDMLPIRFPENDFRIADFYDAFSHLLAKLLDEKRDLNLVFVPHIFKDVAVISEILGRLPDRHSRGSVTVAPYLSGFDGQAYIVDLYNKCHLVLGNRFHTNVCAIGLNVPTIGLVNYPQIQNVYRELNIESRAVSINKRGFETQLEALIHASLQNPGEVKALYSQIKSTLLEEINSFHGVMREWIGQGSGNLGTR